jgi:hypothetical protein
MNETSEVKTGMKIDQILKVKKQVEQAFKNGNNFHNYGSCPECFEAAEEFHSTRIEIEQGRFRCCEKHKVYWVVGTRENSGKMELFSQYTEVQPIFPYDFFNLKKIDELETENSYLKQRLHGIATLANFEPKESQDFEPF